MKWILRPEKQDVLAVFGAAYALILLGPTIAAVGRGAYTPIGDSLSILGGASMVFAAMVYMQYYRRKRIWRSGEVPSEYVAFASGARAKGDRNDYKPNYGVGKLPRPGDVERVVDLALEYIPAELFYSEKQVHGFLERNPGALRCIRTSSAGEISGYYILLALSQRGEDLILDGAVDVGVAMSPSLTLSDPADASALYIGMIQGEGGRGSAAVLLAFVEHLLQIVEQNKKPIRLYARSGHKSSRYLMDKLGFTPVKVAGGVSYLEVAEVGEAQLRELRNSGLRTRRRAERVMKQREEL
ncbi:hypothetical protein [Brachybacterium massiliense]|uniref:hypothetical protein n=1 Tax=Brachybacterium massiliense TaxID=1755098 RepID=UPI0014826F43|nr:hypothetical protein [Brachybacterium massiliense]